MGLTKIVFEDHGQDFLEWTIDERGVVVDCKPFQKDLWVGRQLINFLELEVTWLAELEEDKNRSFPALTIKYPIEAIEEV